MDSTTGFSHLDVMRSFPNMDGVEKKYRDCFRFLFGNRWKMIDGYKVYASCVGCKTRKFKNVSWIPYMPVRKRKGIHCKKCVKKIVELIRNNPEIVRNPSKSLVKLEKAIVCEIVPVLARGRK